MTDAVLKPGLSLLVKLGSIAVHAQEMSGYNFDPRVHGFQHDLAALRTLLDDDEVQLWIHEAGALALLPVTRR